MVKLATLALGTLGVVPALWSGGWFYGKGEIRSQLDAQIAEMQTQGLAASYASLEIGGFPFAYRGRVFEPKSQGYIVTGAGPARADWAAPWVDFDSSLGEFGVVNFALPQQQAARVTPMNGATPYDVIIRAEGLRGRLAQEGGLVRADGGGADIEVTVNSPSEPPYVLKVQKLAAAAAVPAGEAGRITASLDLNGATANGEAWALLDPAQGFPRDPANVRLEATADTVLRADQTLEVSAIDIGHVAVDVAGVSVEGEGGAQVLNRQPDGAMTLRFSGLGGFLTNAVEAGFVPAGQATIYKVMIDSFADKGTREGEQVFRIEFRDGFVVVNGRTTGIPAPILP